MKKAHKTRITESDLNEHIRQENAAYREIIRKRLNAAPAGMSYQITNQRDLRAAFWRDHPGADRKRIRDYSGKGMMYRTDTRVAWCDYVDSLSRDDIISQELAQRATLDSLSGPDVPLGARMKRRTFAQIRKDQSYAAHDRNHSISI